MTDRETNTLASRGLEEPAHASRGLFLINTLLLYPSLSPHRQKDRRTDRRTEEHTHFAWAGGTFFLVVLYVVSVFGSGGKKVLFQTCMYYLEYNTVVVVR